MTRLNIFITPSRGKMALMMTMPITRTPLLCIATLLLATMQVAGAQNIYKCTQGGRDTYTDHPCPGAAGELLHQADDTEVIDRYLRLGQDNLAQQYAETRHLQALYKQRLAVRQQTNDDKARRQDEDAATAQQRADDTRQQALTDEAANRERLRAENDALRQQNDQYRDQLAEPVYNDSPGYWGAPPYYDHDHGHEPPRPPREPVFHSCRQLAGGRVQC